MAAGVSGKSAIETLPIAIERVEQIERDLRVWVTKQIEFSFDPKGTHLFSMVELGRSYARRCVNFADSIRSLLADEQIVPATVLARALIETVAMGCLYIHDMERLTVLGDLERLEKRFMCFYAGVKGQTVELVHVMDAMRHLEKIDTAYATYLDQKYGGFTHLMKALKTAGKDVEGKTFGEMISATKNYDLLSEVSHPNGTGTQLLYPDKPYKAEDVEKLRARFRFESLASIWQCHHLLSALDNSTDLPERYRAAFGSAQSESGT